MNIAKVLVEKIIVNQDINQELIIFYSELSMRVGLVVSTSKEIEILGKYLGELSSYCNYNNLPLI